MLSTRHVSDPVAPGLFCTNERAGLDLVPNETPEASAYESRSLRIFGMLEKLQKKYGADRKSIQIETRRRHIDSRLRCKQQGGQRNVADPFSVSKLIHALAARFHCEASSPCARMLQVRWTPSVPNSSNQQIRLLVSLVEQTNMVMMSSARTIESATFSVPFLKVGWSSQVRQFVIRLCITKIKHIEIDEVEDRGANHDGDND